MINTTARLVDGPLCPIDTDPITTRVRLMAAVLIEKDAYHNERDAMRALQGQFEMVEIIVHSDNARHVAMQEVVAAEMSRP